MPDGGGPRGSGEDEPPPKGSGKLSAQPTGTLWLLAEPLLAAVLGLALGVGMLLAVRAAARLLTPEDPAIGMAKVLVINTAVMGLAIGSLALVSSVARGALTSFGIALVTGFLVAASVELFRFGGLATGNRRGR